MKKQVLITGGAGYIGTSVALEFLQKGFFVTVIDDLKNSYICHLKNLQKKFPRNLTIFKGNLCDKTFLKMMFKDNSYDIVVHLAAKKFIGESLQKPQEYYENNIQSLKNILSYCKNKNTSTFVFASSVVVYGNTPCDKINENCPPSPLNPYAETKKIGEDLVRKWQEKTGKNALVFRFSNPIGANCEYNLGEHGKKKKTTLLNYIIDCILNDKKAGFKGNNFDTPDGSAIRNYIHVSDLAKILTNVTLSNKKAPFEILNLGNDKNQLSVLDLVHIVEKIVDKKLDFTFAEAGKGEIGAMNIDSNYLAEKFDEICKYGIEEIVSSHVEFYKHIQKNRK